MLLKFPAGFIPATTVEITTTGTLPALNIPKFLFIILVVMAFVMLIAYIASLFLLYHFKPFGKTLYTLFVLLIGIFLFTLLIANQVIHPALLMPDNIVRYVINTLEYSVIGTIFYITPFFRD